MKGFFSTWKEIGEGKKVERSLKRFHLEDFDAPLKMVEMHWRELDDELALRHIGRKDTPCTEMVRRRMTNERVHYGTDQQLLPEYAVTYEATTEEFYRHIGPIQQ